MCGIAGITSLKPIEEQIPSALLEQLLHRGPDDHGIYWDSDKTTALVHTRLSILDLSPAGHQPMTNGACARQRQKNGSLWITYNGEIYNFKELRKELVEKGHLFTSQTDTEVILHLYEEEGEKAISRLVGMFAFALYDQPRRRILCARDRLGIKPLYYATQNSTFLFASEIKALLATKIIPREVDWQAISDYFTFFFVPHPATAFKTIRQLPPAHFLIYDLVQREFSLHRYWTPWMTPGKEISLPYETLRDQVRETVTEAVRSELVSDVPLGLFLSGGIDSTLLAAIMTRFGEKPVKTFTVGFRGTGWNRPTDLDYARRVSQSLKTDHRELMVDLSDPAAFLGMIKHVDQPFANPTLFLQFLIAQATRREVSVALSGVGADELFGGYPKYHLLPWAPALQLLPTELGQGLDRVLHLFREDRLPVFRKAKRLLRGMGHSLPEQYLLWSYNFTETQKRQLFSEKIPFSNALPTARIIQEALAEIPPGQDRYGQVFYAELQTFCADNLLEYTDKATMAVSLETRVPYLDHRLVELSARIPFRYKVHLNQSKHILIDAFQDLIPDTIARAPKRGFSFPVSTWIETLLGPYFDAFFSSDHLSQQGFFREDAIQKLRYEHRIGRRDASLELVAILMFMIWYDTYIQGKSLESVLRLS